MSHMMRERWKDPEYRKKVTERSGLNATKWNKPEKQVRKWLKQLNLYKTGDSSGTPGFVPHAWLPTKGAGWSANGDFVDYNNQQVIHVDGVYYHNNPERFPIVVERDRKLDRWCANHSWQWIRLSDTDIWRRPNWCKNMIRRLVAGYIVPAVPRKVA